MYSLHLLEAKTVTIARRKEIYDPGVSIRPEWPIIDVFVAVDQLVKSRSAIVNDLDSLLGHEEDDWRAVNSKVRDELTTKMYNYGILPEKLSTEPAIDRNMEERARYNAGHQYRFIQITVHLGLSPSSNPHIYVVVSFQRNILCSRIKGGP